MRPLFPGLERPYPAAVISEADPDGTIASILTCEHAGAEAFVVDLCPWLPEHRTGAELCRVFQCTGRPMMPLCYRSGNLAADRMSADERPELVLLAIDSGAAACDIMGDMYAPAPRERPAAAGGHGPSRTE